MKMIIKQANIYCVGILSLCLLAQTVQAQGTQKIVKWKDANGVTHYGDMMPSQDAGRSNALLNKEGVVIKKNQDYVPPSQHNKDAEIASADQVRQDSALLASYSSVEEIDLALERNLQTEKNTLKVLEQRLNDAREGLKNKLVLIDGFKKNRKTTPNYLLEEVKASQTKVSKTEAEITETKNNIALTQTRFTNYKTRYAELRPRNQSLSTINVNRKNLAELEAWKKNANEKLSYYLNETIKYKRAATAIPNDITLGIQQANQEIARADQEIATILASIKNSQQTFSSK